MYFAAWTQTTKSVPPPSGIHNKHFVTDANRVSYQGSAFIPDKKQRIGGFECLENKSFHENSAYLAKKLWQNGNTQPTMKFNWSDTATDKIHKPKYFAPFSQQISALSTAVNDAFTICCVHKPIEKNKLHCTKRIDKTGSISLWKVAKILHTAAYHNCQSDVETQRTVLNLRFP